MAKVEFKNVKKELEKLGEEIVAQYKDALVKNNVNASRKLYDSVDYTLIMKDDYSIALYFKAEDYWINVEKGSPKGTVVSNSKIRTWINDKKINYSKGLENRIANSIFNKGIKARPLLNNIKQQLIIENGISKKILLALKKDVKIYLKNKLKNNK